MIPNRLRDDDLKFVLIEKSGKRPFEKGWQNKFIKWDNSILNNHLKNGGNYGVMGGGPKNLIIVDFDDEEVQEKVILKLPQTLTVKTGSGLLHKYFFSNKCESYKIFKEDMSTIADIQGVGKQVVGPGSLHPNGNSYELVDNSPIGFIDYDELKKILIVFDKRKDKPISEKKAFDKKQTNLTQTFRDDIISDLKSQVSMQSLLEEFGVDTSINPTKCPFHGSKGGKCLGFEDEYAHCFHCEGKWNIFSLIQQYKNYDFKEALEWLCDREGLSQELKESRANYIVDKKIENQVGSYVAENNIYEELRKEVYIKLALKDRDKATELIVSKIEKDNHIYTTRDDIKSEMWIYREGVYVPQGKSIVREFSRKILGEAYTTQLSNAIVSKIEADTFIEHDEFFNTNIVDEVPLLNGNLNIKTKVLTEHTPKKIFFNKLPIVYDKTKDCPNIKKHFETTLKDKESVDVMYEIFGYLLLKEYKIEKAFMFVGYGRNGKSKTIELMKRFVGAENCSSLPLRSLTEESFSLSELFGRMANLAADLSKTDLKETGMVKSLIGRDTIQAHRKYLRDLNFVNYAKMVFAANELPKIYDTTDGFWTKWVLLEFPYKFVTQETYDMEQKKDMLKIMDTDIMEKLTKKNELSGLLNLALEGFDRLMDKKDFSYSKSTADVKDMWIRKSDSFTAFCYDHVEESDRSTITKKDLRKIYHKYTKKHKVGSCSDKAIHITLENMFGVSGSQNSSFDRIWDGIRIKNREDLDKK